MTDRKEDPANTLTSDMLRKRIDSADAGDKVDYPDPAAAPLGTDDEAAGTQTDQARVEMAYLEETSRPTHARGKRWWIILGVPTLLTALLAGFIILIGGR